MASHSIARSSARSHKAVRGAVSAAKPTASGAIRSAYDNTVSALGAVRVDGNSRTRYQPRVTLDSLIAQMTTATDDAKTTNALALPPTPPPSLPSSGPTTRQLQQLGIFAPASCPGKPAAVIGYSRSTHPAPTIPATTAGHSKLRQTPPPGPHPGTVGKLSGFTGAGPNTAANAVGGAEGTPRSG
ncbi:hypothetical protein [Kitasatospora sp. LaBMicrA B282]|uniref:hypothetical protein n=1 Tax=Kitasatospora sp. LaBMicrA B282 TaxID=3420949 RepID=UPI003D14EFE7